MPAPVILVILTYKLVLLVPSFVKRRATEDLQITFRQQIIAHVRQVTHHPCYCLVHPLNAILLAIHYQQRIILFQIHVFANLAIKMYYNPAQRINALQIVMRPQQIILNPLISVPVKLVTLH